LISKLLFRRQSLLQLSLAIIGSLCGLLILLASLQAYLDFKNLLVQKTDLINPQYIIVNKKVSVLNTLSFSHNSFSPSEIDSFKKIKTVQRVAGFTSNLFSAQAFIDESTHSNIPGFYTELFFESVDDDLIDVKSEDWKWSPGDHTIPLIIPADYLNLYNFGFAPSQNLPQISKKTVEAATFKIKIEGKDSSAVLDGRIAGFSSRINSFLVPENFLLQANQTFGIKEAKNPSRLIVVSSDPSSPELMRFLEENGYETSAENLKNSRLNLVLRIIMNVLAGIGFMIILLSLLGFIQYSQLMISRSKYEIQTLIQLGYYHFTITKRLFYFYLFLYTMIFAVTISILLFLKTRFISVMKENGFEIEQGISSDVFIFFFGIFIFLLVANTFSIYKNIKMLAKPL
jgi:hypothetical protein